jgi:hypothetical protein
MICTKAQKRHTVRAFTALAAYVVTFSSTSRYVRDHHPQGVALYVCAALPWVMMCGVIVSIGLYFHEERDGYSRDLAMRTMLWGAGASMAANLFLWFLRMFGWTGQAPGILELCVFGGATMVARIAYGIANRPECERTEIER